MLNPSAHPTAYQASEALVAYCHDSESQQFIKILHKATANLSFNFLMKGYGLKHNLSSTEYDYLFINVDYSSEKEIRSIVHNYPRLSVIAISAKSDVRMLAKHIAIGCTDCVQLKQYDLQSIQQILLFAKERKHFSQQDRHSLVKCRQRIKQLEESSKYDPATDLPNFSLLQDMVEKSVSQAKRQNKSVALLMLDIYGLEDLKQRYPYLYTKVLRNTLKQIKDLLRSSDSVACVGEDRFAIITDLIEDSTSAKAVAKKIHIALEYPIQYQAKSYSMRAKIGVSSFPECYNASLLLDGARTALETIADNPSENTHFLSDTHHRNYQQHRQIEKCLRQSTIDSELCAFYQPIVNNAQGSVGLEALCRWRRPNNRWVSPQDFIPVAENSKSIYQITKKVFSSIGILRQQLAQQSRILPTISVNLSARQLLDIRSFALIEDLAEECEIPLSKLCIEIKERDLLDYLPQIHCQLEIFRDNGVSIALDDYGTGMTAMRHLREFPIDQLKMDAVLVRNLESDPRNQAVVAGIIESAQRLAIKTIAEGVETQAEKDCLQELGCHFYQGYYFAKPMGSSDIRSYLAAH